MLLREECCGRAFEVTAVDDSLYEKAGLLASGERPKLGVDDRPLRVVHVRGQQFGGRAGFQPGGVQLVDRPAPPLVAGEQPAVDVAGLGDQPRVRGDLADMEPW
jgi:hypothetical protein